LVTTVAGGIDSRQGDAALPSFGEAVDAHKAMVFSIGWHFLRDRVAAEELAQDVFLQLYRNWTTMKSPNHVVFWLRKITSHRAIDQVRRRKIRPEMSLEEAGEPTVLERMQDSLLSSYLERMVASLPERQRMAIVLRYQEDMDPDEIAKVLEMKVSSVKTLISRGLELLRAKTGRRLGITDYRDSHDTV
jgi:RNA polymerase sigma-70 factor (ECF subfamily)